MVHRSLRASYTPLLLLLLGGYRDCVGTPNGAYMFPALLLLGGYRDCVGTPNGAYMFQE